MPNYPRNPYYKRYFKGNPINHPPIPSNLNRSSSIELTPRLNTGKNPGPGSEGPLDPRLYYPRTIRKARARGQGCSSCRWRGVCKIFYFQRNFGYINRDHITNYNSPNATSAQVDPKLGTGCESWNVDFPPLPPEAYDQDGLGLGDPVSAGRVPASAYDPFRYDGQYGDLRSDIGNRWDTRNL
jgi:hypothetical protein